MRAEPILQVALLLQSALEQRLDSLLRFQPCQRGRKGVAAVEEPVDGWQRDVVDQIFAVAIGRRSKEARRRATSSTNPSNSLSGGARLT